MFHNPQRLDQLTVLPGQQALTRAQQAQEALRPQQGALVGDVARDGMVEAATRENVALAGLGNAQSGQSSQLHLAHMKHLQDFTEQEAGPLPGRQGVRKMAAKYDLEPTQVTAQQLAKMIGLA